MSANEAKDEPWPEDLIESQHWGKAVKLGAGENLAAGDLETDPRTTAVNVLVDWTLKFELLQIGASTSYFSPCVRVACDHAHRVPHLPTNNAPPLTVDSQSSLSSHLLKSENIPLSSLHCMQILARTLLQIKQDLEPSPIMSSNDNSSTLQSYVDSATGTVQSAIGSLTGSTGDQVGRLCLLDLLWKLPHEVLKVTST